MHAASDTHGALSLSLLFMVVVVVSVRLKRRLHAGFCVDEVGRGTRMRVRDKKSVQTDGSWYGDDGFCVVTRDCLCLSALNGKSG